MRLRRGKPAHASWSRRPATIDRRPAFPARAPKTWPARTRLLLGSFVYVLVPSTWRIRRPRACTYMSSHCARATHFTLACHTKDDRLTGSMVQGSDQAAGAMESSPGRAVAPAASQAMTVGGVLTVAGSLLIFVLLALALSFFQYCFNDRGRTSPSVRRRGRGMAGAGDGNSGVDPEVLRSLPITVYRAAGSKEEGEAAECAVCLAELEDGEEARFLPRCGHGFHAECIDLWLASHSTCPLCRLTIGKPDMSPQPPSATLPSVPPEQANYAANLPASVLLGVSDQGELTAVTVTTDSAGPSPAAAATSVLVTEIPESSAAVTPRDVAAKSPGSARLRSLIRLWSFGRQGPGGSTTPSCSCGGADEGADVEQAIGVTAGARAVEAPPLAPEAAAGATPRASVQRRI